ncbi:MULTISPECIES: zonular occludens toxin domain-containing protein [unclassified Lysobacter]|uniref:zonular occludens toxin domain-containing protein n=1 Tax=unclassified Lysobacter TaxID=2635362 RepID=UPI0006F8FC3E|nr:MULTISPECIES: zonular occludens toxin domain-containing protein [unclassified Lysobacter]KRC33936.1 hypothetical protein ASE10_13450 [Lysobacter sp. Root76]KRD69270.1 hypothetical protein ASE45_08890 [Lysobacter sp. Root96]
MLICNEGPPRAGKSYDAVKTHILPAIKGGRHVYARLNGLDHEKIAVYLQLPETRVRELLTLVGPDEVVPLFTAFGDDPPKFNVKPDSLIVIDEVHEFYVSGRQALAKEQEAFFAKHGHIGLDIVVMTQALGRLHSSIRQRIERKSVFTKLNALGREDRYAVRFYSVGDTMGKFEKISSETHDYDAEVYPLYKGFQAEAKNTGAYTAGSKTVWQVIKMPAIGMAVLVVLAIGGIWSFFAGNGTIVGEEDPNAPEYAVPAKTDDEPVTTPGHAPRRVSQSNGTAGVQDRPKVDEFAKYPAGVRMLLEMAKSARPRYAGTIGQRHILEWRTPQGQALERLTSDQLRALGWNVTREPYGVLATFQDRSLIFTAWPLLEPIFSQSTTQAARIREAGASLPSVSEGASRSASTTASVPGAIIQAGQQTGYGDIGVGPNANGVGAGGEGVSMGDRDERG